MPGLGFSSHVFLGVVSNWGFKKNECFESLLGFLDHVLMI